MYVYISIYLGVCNAHTGTQYILHRYMEPYASKTLNPYSTYIEPFAGTLKRTGLKGLPHWGYYL